MFIYYVHRAADSVQNINGCRGGGRSIGSTIPTHPLKLKIRMKHQSDRFNVVKGMNV